MDSVQIGDNKTSSLREHVEQVLKAYTSTLAATKHFYEARGANKLNKTVRKIQMADGSEMGLDDLKAYQKKVAESIRMIPRIVADEERAQREKKKALRAEREVTSQPPNQYSKDLVDFFKKADMGGLQKNAEMKAFFDHGIGNRTFGVSLFNVYSNIHKLNTGNAELVLDAAGAKALSGALNVLKEKARAVLANPESDAGHRTRAQHDLELLEANKLQNKDYMTILSHYCDKSSDAEKLKQYTPHVERMSEITRALRSDYREKLLASRPKPVKAVKEVTVKQTAPVKSNVVMPQVPAAPAAKAQAIPTINGARGASPATKKTRA